MLKRATLSTAMLYIAVECVHCALPSVDEYTSGTGKSGTDRGDGGVLEGGSDDAAIANQDGAESGTSTPFLSCAPGGPGMTNCGAGSESCCTSLPVAGGAYGRTYTNNGGGPTGVADQATVANFRLDKYEVTVGRFRQFVNAVFPTDGKPGWLPSAGAGKHTHLNGGQGLVNTGSAGGYEPGWISVDDGQLGPTSALACDVNYATWTLAPGSRENQPINCVNWFEAYAFCIWDGGFLPSEAEWEYAAAGGSEQRQYPWGYTDPGTANLYAIFSCYYPSGSGTCKNTSNIAPVGTPAAGAGRWGQLDLVGNMWEWNLDYFGPSYASPCVDCANLTPGTSRVYRGGSFDPVTASLGPSYRSGGLPTSRAADRGVRCARTP